MYTCTDISDSQISGLFHSLIVPHVLLLSPSTEKCLNTCAVGTFGQLGVGDRSPQILAYVLTVNPIRTGEGALIPPPLRIFRPSYGLERSGARSSYLCGTLQKVIGKTGTHFRET